MSADFESDVWWHVAAFLKATEGQDCARRWLRTDSGEAELYVRRSRRCLVDQKLVPCFDLGRGPARGSSRQRLVPAVFA